MKRKRFVLLVCVHQLCWLIALAYDWIKSAVPQPFTVSTHFLREGHCHIMLKVVDKIAHF